MKETPSHNMVPHVWLVCIFFFFTHIYYKPYILLLVVLCHRPKMLGTSGTIIQLNTRRWSKCSFLIKCLMFLFLDSLIVVILWTTATLLFKNCVLCLFCQLFFVLFYYAILFFVMVVMVKADKEDKKVLTALWKFNRIQKICV